MESQSPYKLQQVLIEELESQLTDRYGPMMSGKDLYKALGYVSDHAFRQGLVRNTVNVPIFSIPHRRGKFALTKDVAVFLAQQRASAK
ncbi:hypothetical protein [Reinekea blandensis]|uniref:Uncharacterized protein n=1 Tax=Reinekea blandensis MED297 TaxID=314283 RepID=A4B8W7_9GAMM|nr:hypothetical protein [Reinekea blandensis]EAR11068.1 hypothetical protein MED297_19312 [Reinekea sp. MED297] [Reinekea blandensis MED297]